MFFVYPTPQYPRHTKEYVFKSLYHLVSVFHVISISVVIADFYLRLQASMPEYFTNSNLVISSGIELLLTNCSYTGSIHLGNVHGNTLVSRDTIGYALMTTAQYIIALFVVEFLLLCNNTVSAYNYTTENRHLRICGIHVPLYHINVVLTYGLSVAVIVITWSFDVNRRFFDRALRFCAASLEQENATVLWESEFDGNTIFSTAVYWPFGVTCVGLVIYTMALMVLAYYSCDEGTRLLSEADAPWERRGIMCSTSKPLLKLHTIQRNAILHDAREAIHNGEEVRIVRSYQLMTESDFEALVQAMRDQAAQLMKERQFEKLRENFGDRESQIDETQFMWRHNLTASPPSPTLADQFYDVDFDNYFDAQNNINSNARRRLPLEENTPHAKDQVEDDMMNTNLDGNKADRYIRYNNDMQYRSNTANYPKEQEYNNNNTMKTQNVAYYSPASSSASQLPSQTPPLVSKNGVGGGKVNMTNAEVSAVVEADSLGNDTAKISKEVKYVEPQPFSPAENDDDFNDIGPTENEYINRGSHQRLHKESRELNENFNYNNNNKLHRERHRSRRGRSGDNNDDHDNDGMNNKDDLIYGNSNEHKRRLRRTHSLQESPHHRHGAIHDDDNDHTEAFPLHSSPDVLVADETGRVDERGYDKLQHPRPHHQEERYNEEERGHGKKRRSRKGKKGEKTRVDESQEHRGRGQRHQHGNSLSPAQRAELEDADEEADELSESFDGMDDNFRYEQGKEEHEHEKSLLYEENLEL